MNEKQSQHRDEKIITRSLLLLLLDVVVVVLLINPLGVCVESKVIR